MDAFCTPCEVPPALNLGNPVSFSTNTSHTDRVGQKRSFRHVLAEQQGSALPSASPSPNSACFCHTRKFRRVISCPQVDINTSTVLSFTKLRLIPHDPSSWGSITHFYSWAGSIKLPFNHPQLTELP